MMPVMVHQHAGAIHGAMRATGLGVGAPRDGSSPHSGKGSVMGRVLFNRRVNPQWVGVGPGRDPMLFHARLPGYEPTPLLRLPNLARQLGVGEFDDAVVVFQDGF